MVLTAEEKRQRGAEAVRRHRSRETNEERQERLRRDRVRHREYREHGRLSVSTRALSVAQVLPTRMDNVAAATAASIGPRRSRAWIEEDYQRLHPVSEATKLKAIQCLREALGAVGLDEVVCAVCDACTLQSRCVRVNLSDHKYVTKMKRLLCCEGEELPPALVAQYDCSGMHPELHSLLLSARGVDPEGDVIMCKECHASISKSQIPKFSIKNGFYVGRLPAELEDTTLPERLMTQLVSIVAVTRVVRGGIHRAIRSHCLMFDATPGPAATLLPSQLGDATTFRVVLAGPFTSLQQARVRKMHQVRRRALERLLDFYSSYNALYDNVTFDCSTVPSDSFPNHIFQEVQEAEAEADDVDRELDHLGGATETDMTSREDDVIERRVVFVADDREPSQEPVGSNDSTAAKRILVRHSSHFATRDNNLFAKMFPHLFPFGRGHPGEKRHCPVSFDLCIRHYCLLSSRRFVEDELFMLASFDHISLQRMYTQIALRCKRKPEQFAPYCDVSEVELLDALVRKQRRRQGRSAASREEATSATHLLETVELSGAALWGSDSERAQCRRQAFAYQIRYGQPALFITLTPNVSESFVMAQYSGVTSVDTLFDAELSRKPSKSELQGASMKNDAASARLFVRYVNAFIDHVLRVSSTGAIAKSTGDGLLGRVKAYFGMVETQGGGTLHAHFLVWLCAAPPNLDAYKRMMARFGDRYRRDIEAYTDSVVTTAPALNIASSSCVRCGHSYADLKPLPIPDDAFDDPDRQRHGSAAEPLLVQCPQCALKVSSQHVLRRLLLDHRPASWPPPLRNLSEDEMDAAVAREVPRRGSMANARQALFRRDLFLTSKSDGDEQPDPEGDYLRMLNRVPQRTERRQDDVFRADSVSRSIAMMPPSCDDARWPALTFEFVVSVLMYLFNLHWWCHVGSCFKKRRSGAPGTCRYRFPQARVAETIAADDGLTIARRTACEYVNGYNPVMMATFKSNHDVQVLIGGADALLRIYYATKYVTKSQELVESVTAVALAAFRKRQARELLDQSEPQDRATVGRRRAGSLGFAISNRREVAGPLAALYLLGGSCCFKSTKTAPLPLADIVRQLTRNASYECDLVNVSQSNDNTVYRSTTLLDDYRFRPRRLDDLCLYEFVAWHFRRKQTAAASAESAFLPDHPLVSTHCLGTHTQEVIPLIAGARVPYVDSNSPPDIVQERTKYALTLFKPFRAVTDLVADTANDAAWNNAYRDWFPTCSAFVQEILHNMDDSHNAKTKAKEAVANAHSDYDDPDPAAADDTTGTRNDVDVAAGLGIDTFADGEEWSSGADDIFGTDDHFPVFPTAVSDAESAQAFRELLASSAEATAASFATLQQSPAVESRLPDFTEDEYKHWLEDASTDEAAPSAGFRQENPTQVIELLSKTLESDSSQRPPSAEHVQQPSTIEYYASIAEVSSAFTLNDRQHIAFTLIATALLRRFLLQEQSELDSSSDYRGQNYAAALQNQQLLMFLGGAGGTGKSRVIDAVDALCRSWHRESSLVKTALTGKAATLIGARTLASFLLRIKHAAKDKQFAPLDALVIDEVSMMSKRELLKLDQSLRKYKLVPDVPFGGVHIILVGDFLQMPPVGADAIFINPDSKRNASVIDSDGFDLWRRFTTVVVLNESVRFRRDPEWGEGCRLARVGVWTENFVKIINSRVFQAADVARLALESSVLVTPENVTRLAINNAFIAQTASQMPDGTYPIRVLADFKGALNELSQSDVAYVLGLPDNRFGRLAPYLDLIAGMPVQITQNVGTAKGVANGTLGTLESVHFLPGTAFKLVMDGASGMLVQIPSQPPDYALLRLPRPRAVPLRPGLDPELFPVFFNTTVFSKMNISLPPAPGGHRRYVELKIHQFPFVPAIGSTVYKIQGETLDSMVVVDWKSALAMVNKPQQTYLLVSRVTSRHAFIALSPLTTKLQRWSKPPPGALEEEDRLNDLNNRTIAGFHQQRVLTTAGSSGGGRSSNPLQH